MDKYQTRTQKIFDIFRDLFYTLVNLFRVLNFYKNFVTKKEGGFLKTNISYKSINSSARCFVLGNGPSLKAQKIASLKNEVVFMVNRSFLDKRYKDIKPKYHVFMDSKLSTGQWPLEFLDQIKSINPNVTFILNAKWYHLDLFREVKKKFNLIWVDFSLTHTRFNFLNKVDLTRPSYGKNVVENAILVAAYMGYKKIYVSGIDGDGFASLLLERDSHSYGKNTEDTYKFSSASGIREALFSVVDWMLAWHYLNKYLKAKNISLINLTGRGIFKMLDQERFENVIEELENEKKDTGEHC